MDTIAIKTFYNSFSNENFYVICVNDKILEEYVTTVKQAIAPSLVPTLLNWLDNSEERKIVWDRVIPQLGQETILPILMCSEDLDFTCTLIVVKVVNSDSFIYWQKMGIDNTEDIWKDISKVGSTVDWIDEIPVMKFDKKQYIEVINKFKYYLDLPNDNEDVYKSLDNNPVKEYPY